MKVKFSKNVSLKTYIATIVAITIILVTSIGYVFSQSNGTFTISHGIYPGAPSYTVWVEGDDYFSKNMYGQIRSDSNFSALMQYIIDFQRGNSEGTRILLEAGNFWVGATITVYDYVEIVGTGGGDQGTYLKLSDGVNCNMFNLNGSFIRFKSLKLWGGDNSAGIGICADPSLGGDSSGDTIVEDCFILQFPEEGIYWTDCWGAQIINSYIEYNWGYGAWITARNNLISGSTFSFNHKSGMRISGGGGTAFPACISIINSAFVENYEHGIYFSGSDSSIVDNCLFIGNGVSAPGTYSGIYINAGDLHLTVSNNVFHGNSSRDNPPDIYTKHGVRVESNSYVSIVGNSFLNLDSIAVYASWEYHRVIVVGNNGFMTENCGTAVGMTSPITVSHQLGHTPLCVIVTPNGDYGDFWVSDVGALTFDINYDAGGVGGETFYWYASVMFD